MNKLKILNNLENINLNLQHIKIVAAEMKYLNYRL